MWMMGQSAHSANLQMTQKLEECLTACAAIQRDCRRLEGQPQTKGYKMHLKQWRRIGAKFCTLGGTNQYGLGSTQLERTSAEKDSGFWGTPNWTWAGVCPQGREIPWPALRQVLPAGWGGWSIPSTWHYWSQSWSAVSSSGFPRAREKWMYWSKSSKGSQKLLMCWSTSPVMKSWENWDCSAQKRLGGISSVWQVPEERVQRR